MREVKCRTGARLPLPEAKPTHPHRLMPAPIDLAQFEQAAQKSGKIHISSDNKVSSSSQGLLRRLRGANSKEEEQNKAVRAALLESLEAKFGKDFADSVAGKVDVNSPRSLDAKTVKELIKAGNQNLELKQNANRIISNAFSNQGQIESMFARKAEEMGFNQPLSGQNLQKLQNDITTAIAREADGNRKLLTEQQTGHLAEQEIQKFIGQNMGQEVGKSIDQQQQDLQAYVQSFPPLKNPPPSVLPPLPGEQPQANVQSFAPLKNPPPSVLPPLPGEQPQANVQSFAPLKNPPPKVLPPLPDEQAAELKRSPSVRDDLNKKGAVSNNAFKLQDDAMKAGKSTRNNLPASNKPSAPAKGSSIKNG